MLETPTRSGGRIRTAEILSIGTEITVGETRDTNAAELASSLTAAGVVVGRIVALPDRLDVVRDAFRDGVSRADLVVSTGGLGPTPDDLTREAIAAVCGETPIVDPGLEGWLRDLWARRSLDFPESNRKQAWLIPSAGSLANPNGTAPGWFVRAAGGGVIVALPGPPREMRPMWAEEALPRLRTMGLGTDLVSRTYRLTGIGESQVAERLRDLIELADPEVATYARSDAVDVRVSAGGGDGRDAAARVEEVGAVVADRLRDHIWATGSMTWAEALDAALAGRGWALATAESGTRGHLATLLGEMGRLRGAMVRPGAPDTDTDGSGGEGEDAAGPDEDAGGPGGSGSPRDRLLSEAEEARRDAGADVGLVVQARERGADMVVAIAIVAPGIERVERRVVFLGGTQGRARAALTAAAALLLAIRVDPPG